MSKEFTIHKGKKSQVEHFMHARTRMLEELRASQHRLEEVEVLHDVVYVNDSSATSIMATMDSIRCISNPMIWILNATQFDRDFILMSKIVRHKVKGIIVCGLEAQDIRSALEGCVDHFHICETLDEALLEAKGIASSGDVVLYSPSAPAGRYFENVNDRGNGFRALAAQLRARL